MTVLVVDFGAQYAQLIARRVREARVYSEIVQSSITAEEVRAKNPTAIILSGGPKSVYEVPAPSLDPAIYELGVPMLGICYGAQLMALQLGGEVAHTGGGEYGRTELTRQGPSPLMEEWPATQSCWMSHGDAIARAPEGFVVTASTPRAPVAVMEDASRRLYATQFHPEVAHSERGQELLENFLHHVAEIPPTWTNTSIIDDQVAAIRAQVGEELGLPAEIVWRQPFPGPGLGVRIIGEVTRERAEILRNADHVVVDEIKKAGLYRELWQSFAVLPAVRTVGVMGDGRTYAYPIVIRAVTSDDAMTADWARLPYDVIESIANRLIREVPGVNRVALDVTSKPPGTIEWE